MSTLPNLYSSGTILKLFGRLVAPIRGSMKEDIKMKNAKVGVFPAAQTKPHSKLRKAILNPIVCSVGATLGIFGGVSSLIAGLICVSIHLFVSQDVVFDRAGTTLLILGIPLLLVGSVFLDEIETKK